VHMQTAEGEAPNAGALVALYDLLVDRRPSIGAKVGRALAHGALHGPETGLRLLAELGPEASDSYQPFWAARLHLTRRSTGAVNKADLDRALSLTTDAAARAFLTSEYATTS